MLCGTYYLEFASKVNIQNAVSLLFVAVHLFAAVYMLEKLNYALLKTSLRGVNVEGTFPRICQN